MKQLLQSLKTGETIIEEVPAPNCCANGVLVESSVSLVSAGTERMLVDFGKSSLLGKAKSQPDKVLEVLAKVKTDGIISTYEAVQSKLDQPLPLGYCNVGRVIETTTEELKIGDRVASNGYHAEVVTVPSKLCAKIPDNVSDETASFTVLSAIALQGIRLINPTLGETVVVYGLGLIGLLSVQILKANGCRVIGVDVNEERINLAKKFGAITVNSTASNDLVSEITQLTKDIGVDAVLITASSTSQEILSNSAQMCRKRGRVVLVGVIGLQLRRDDFYHKEISFQVSCSYGPGRYDPDYERDNKDYPIAYVRWTEQRNFEAVLGLMSEGKIVIDDLISHRFSIVEAQKAMQLLTSDEPSTGIVLRYAGQNQSILKDKVIQQKVARTDMGATLAFIGAGNYVSRVLLPAFKVPNACMHTLVSDGGISAAHFGKKFGFQFTSTNEAAVFEDDSIDAVVIGTRHYLHAWQVLSALNNGKHVFCEKPLCLTMSELDEIKQATSANPNLILMVGFNRRFSPFVVKMKQLISTVSKPKCVNITVNAGHIPREHWTQSQNVGGGRIIGEACHFIDLARHLIGEDIIGLKVSGFSNDISSKTPADVAAMTVDFADGSFAVIKYLANGHKSFPKERVEVFCDGKILALDNFRKLKGFGWSSFSSQWSFKQDKGQRNCVLQFVNAINGEVDPPIPISEILNVSEFAILAADKLRASNEN